MQMNDDVEVWTMEFQAHVKISLYRNRLGSSFPKCLWKMEDLFNNHADHSCDSWMVPVLNPGVQFNGIGLCIYIYIHIYSTHTNIQSMLVQKGLLGLFGTFTFQRDSSIGNFRIIEPFDMQSICTESFLQGQAFLRVFIRYTGLHPCCHPQLHGCNHSQRCGPWHDHTRRETCIPSLQKGMAVPLL